MATVDATLDSGYRVKLSSNGHVWHADEPVELGGTDTGPNPYELLLGALASCKVITLSMYCQRKGLDLTGVTVRLQHNREHKDDCDHCEDMDEGWLEHVEAKVVITGQFDDKAAERVKQIAGRCPVHKTLEKGMHVVDNVTVQRG